MTDASPTAASIAPVIADDLPHVIAAGRAVARPATSDAAPGDRVVVLETAGGAWLLSADLAAGRYLATWRPGPADQPALLPTDLPIARAASSWELEPRIRVEIPFVVHAALITGLAPGVATASPDPDDPETVAATAERHIPRPADRVHIPTMDPLTYRQALAYTRPAQAWHWPAGQYSDDDYRLEILDAPLVGADRRALVYRLRVNDEIVFCGDDIEVPAAVDLSADATARALVAMLTHPDPAAPLTAGQRQFLSRHSQDLDRVVAPVPTPYSAGTRIQTAGPGGTPVTGTVVEAVHGAGTVTSYRWRPDAADLPGHPWRHLSGSRATVTTPAGAVTATLLGPDTGLPRLHHDPRPLAYGAIISYLTDDGATLTGDVIRVMATDGDIDYEIRFHGQPPDQPPAVLPGRDVVAVRGTAWPSPEALLAARRADTTDPLVLGELLVAADGTYAFSRLDQDGTDHVWSLDIPEGAPPWADPTTGTATDPDLPELLL